MCNIAGYAGNKQAAPILLEMLRKQELYDGDMSTGVATIHEGKLYYQKVVGNVDNFLKNVDLSLLPGTIGIAHTRPGGADNGIAPHPFISMDKRTALVTNGTTPATKYCSKWDEGADLLDSKGYVFFHESKNSQGRSPKLSRNGNYVSPAEARVHLADYYMKQGKTPTEALALACPWMYSDNVTVMLTENAPDQISLLRTTRPMVCVMENDETYIATTRFGLPQELAEEAFDLPLFYAITVKRDGITVTKNRMDAEPVMEMTPYTYYESYKRIEALLKSEKAPLYFDELEFAIGDMRDLWPDNHTCVQHARLVYDLLWQFDKEGRLRRETRVQDRPGGPRRRYYMWLDK